MKCLLVLVFIGVVHGNIFDFKSKPCGEQTQLCKWYKVTTGIVPSDCFPWVVSIQNKVGDHVCAGSVYRDRWVVTAAQCVSSKDPAAFTVVFGQHDLSAPVPDAARYEVQAVLVHEGFTGQPPHAFAENNIALLQVTRDFQFGPNDTAPCFPFANHKLKRNTVVVAGWGDRNVVGYQRSQLQFVLVDTTDNHYCESCSEGPDFFGSGHDSALYVGKNSKSVCIAGPGGPAFTIGHNGWQLQGIASRRIESAPCDADRHPAPLTSIAYHYGWIRATPSGPGYDDQ